jgi:hypothetical protein
MPDVLTHVFVGYVLGSLLAARVDRLESGHVTLVMAGALSPDFTKIKLLLPDATVEAALGVPFSWFPLHALGGTVVVSLLAGLVVDPRHRRLTVVLVALGAGSHFLLDGLLLTPTGHTAAFLWPLSTYRPPAGMLYLSTDRLPALVAGSGAGIVWVWRRRARVGDSART